MPSTRASRRRLGLGLAATTAVAALALMALPAGARPLTVDVRSDRGDQAVYQPGDPITIDVRATDDAYVLVYEIDAQGYVHVLYPYAHASSGYIEGGSTLNLPPGDAEQLVVEGPTGQGYIVAIASREPFNDLPWYLRPYDAQADELGYTGDDDAREDEGVTTQGQIVGDPFVAMERIRRAVLADPGDRGAFATGYTSYYVHEAVRYPRYICNDCHRPGEWQWWDGFDPYYTTCSAFDFRVNSGWWWGPSYWFGTVPYYVYVYRPDCPPQYRGHGHSWFSSWDGWSRWTNLWGGSMRRYKTPPPAGYISPAQFEQRRFRGANRPTPPGFLASAHGEDRRQGGIRRAWISGSPGPSRWGADRPVVPGLRGSLGDRASRGPAGAGAAPDGGFRRDRVERGGGDAEPTPRVIRGGERPGRGEFVPSPGGDRGGARERSNWQPRPVYDHPSPRIERGGGERSSPPPSPRVERGADRGADRGGGWGQAGGGGGGRGRR